MAPWSNPPRYETAEVVPDKEWSVVIRENVPGQKFEHYEITLLIRKLNSKQSEVGVQAFRINTLLPKEKRKAGRVAKKYAEQLAKKLKRE